MKYSVYFCEGDLSKEEFRRALTLEALSAYCLSHDIDFNPEKAVMLKGEKGKPYIEGLPVHFNVSHSENLWLCIVGEAPCGIDIQVAKECDYEKIARKHFDEVEQAYVKLAGSAGFFRLWTRREAYGKYTGEGFYGRMPAFIDFEGKMLAKAGKAYIRDIFIAEDIFCVWCTGGSDDEIEFFGR